MKTIIFLLLIFSPPLLKGQTTISSLDEAFQLARRNNQNICITEKLAASERAGVKALHSSFLPRLKGISSFDYNYALPVQLVPAEFLGGKEGEFKAVQFGTNYVFSAGVEASMPLINTSLWAETKIAEFKAAAAKERVTLTEREVLENVARGYYLCLLSSHALEISKKNLKNADTLLSMAQTRYENQLIDQLDLNRFVNQQIRLKNELEQRKSLYQNNLRLLKYHLGLKQSDSLLLIKTDFFTWKNLYPNRLTFLTLL